MGSGGRNEGRERKGFTEDRNKISKERMSKGYWEK